MACKYKYNDKWYSEEELINVIQNENSNFSTLYNNLLKELESGKGKEILDRVKRDYVSKKTILDDNLEFKVGDDTYSLEPYNEPGEEHYKNGKLISQKEYKDAISNNYYTLEEQQEEAIVELLGLLSAKKLDDVKDGKLISLLKRLLKEMATFMRNLLRQKEIEVDKLPDNMTLNDLADLLAYSNSKIILPGNEVTYTTPDNQTFKTYQEASNHISKLANSIKDVDLGNLKAKNKAVTIKDVPDNFHINMGDQNYPIDVYFAKGQDDLWYEFNYSKDPNDEGEMLSEDTVVIMYNRSINQIDTFIEKNKEFEQSKEIIEEWKKVNDIVYNPEEVYSRGQGFYSVVGAYSQFDVSLMFQNLLHHIEDNKKAGGHFAISAFTKPIDKNISHLEGGGGKIKFVIYPKSEDILWATNKDAYSGSVWDAGEKVNKDKKSELLGVSYTKYPSSANINSVQPNLASIVDNLSDHHNELGIVLNNNFRMEYDEDVPYQIKKIIDANNKILDEKFGKIKKPNVNQSKDIRWRVDYQDMTSEREFYFSTEKEALEFVEKEKIGQIPEEQVYYSKPFKENFNGGQGIQPTITEKDLKESINTIKDKVVKFKTSFDIEELSYQILEDVGDTGDNDETPFGLFITNMEIGGNISDYVQNFETREQAENWVEDNGDEYRKSYKSKEYNEQALINTKISALKEVAKKYPRSLIRSEVRNTFSGGTSYQKLNSKGATQKKYTLQIGKKDFTKGTYTFKEIFNNIGENSYATKLLKQLYMFSNKSIDNMKIEIVDSLDEAIGNYNPETHTISLSTQAIKGDELLAHEIIHALTAIKIAYWEKKNPAIYKKLEEVYLKAKDKLDDEEYAFSNIHEFYAHLSDSEFVERLATIKSEGFWSKFIDLISSMLAKLGINIQNTLAEEALNNLETIITARLAEGNVQEGIDNLKEAKLNSKKQSVIIGGSLFEEGVYTFKQIFDNIESNTYSMKMLKALYEKSSINIDNIKIKIVATLDGYVVGRINLATNDIELSTVSRNIEETFAHEIIHALTSLKITYWRENNIKLYNEIHTIYELAKKELDKNDDRYEFSNVYEFYAHLSETNFLQELSDIKYEASILEKIFDFFRKALSSLGYNIKGTLAEKSLMSLEKIISTKVNSNDLSKGLDYFIDSLNQNHVQPIFDDEFENEDEQDVDEQLATILDNTDITLLDGKFDFWKKLVITYHSMMENLKDQSNTTAGFTLLKSNEGSMKAIHKINTDKIENDVERAIRQGATLALYVETLKYNLLDKKSDVIGSEHAFASILSRNLLSMAKQIKETYDDIDKARELTSDDHAKYLTISNYISAFIEQHKEHLSELKELVRNSENQSEQINEYLASIGESTDYNSTIENMQLVIDTMDKIKRILKETNALASALALPEEGKVGRAIYQENKADTLHNNKLNEQISQLEAKQVDATDEMKELLQLKIDKLRSQFRKADRTDVILDINREIQDGNDMGFFQAIATSISDMGDKALSLLKNRVVDLYNKLQQELVGIVEEYSADFNLFAEGGINLNDDKAYEKFFEKVTYTNKEGKTVTQKVWVTNVDEVSYLRDYHICNNKVAELWEAINALTKVEPLSENPTTEELRLRTLALQQYDADRKQLLAQMDVAKDAFLQGAAVHRAKIEYAEDEQGNEIAIPSTVASYFKRHYDYMIAEEGEHRGRETFKNFIAAHYDIGRMKRTKGEQATSTFRQLSNRKFLDLLVDEMAEGKESFNIANQVVYPILNYRSTLLKANGAIYTSDKLNNLNEKERKHYDFLYNRYTKAQKLLPAFARPGNRLPSVSKSMVQKFMNNELSIKGVFEEMVKTHSSDEITENQSSNIPIYYTNANMQADEVSTNLVQTTLMFEKQARAYDTKRKAIQYAKAMQNTMGATKAKKNERSMLNSVLAKMGIDKKIPIGTDWREWFLKMWIDQEFYGKTNRPIEVAGIRIDKVLQKFAAFSAFGTLGGIKIISNFTNASMSTMTILLETTGYFEGSNIKPLFTAGQFVSSIAGAGKTMFDNALDFVKRNEFPSSIYGQIMQEFEPIQGEFFNTAGNTINTHLVSDMHSIWFSPMHLGDTMPQTMTLIATLKNIPVILLNGTKTDLWEALTHSDDLQANWENIEGWRAVKKDFFDNKKRELDELNKKMHGNYNSIGNVDRPLLRQVVFGQMLEMYKKYIVTGMIRRYGKGDSDLQTGKWSEGYYRTLFRYIFKDMRWMLNAGKGKVTPLDILFPTAENLDVIRQFYSDEQIINIRKAVREQAWITFTSLLAVLLLALAKSDGDDDDNEILMYAAAVTTRLSGDFGFYSPVYVDTFIKEDGSLTLPIGFNISQTLKLAKNPFAVSRTVDTIESMINILSSDPLEEYTTGKKAHKSKLLDKTVTLLGLKQGSDPETVLNLMYKNR